MTMKIKMIPVKLADVVTTSVLKLQLLCKMRGIKNRLDGEFP